MTLDSVGRAVDAFLEHVSGTSSRIVGTSRKMTRAQHEFLHLTRGSRNDEVDTTVANVAGALSRLDEAHRASIAAMYAIEEYCRAVGIPVRPRAADFSAVTSTATLPSHAGAPRPPSGVPTPARPTRKPETGLRRENECAQVLAAYGYHLEQNPPKRPNGKKPDYLLEGRYFDCYAPTTEKISEIRKMISRKIKKGQAERIVLSLDDSPVELDDIRQILHRKPVSGLCEVLAIRRNRVIALYP
ncbi:MULTISPECIES: hypothetical protein [unclassified Solwaraspora]|uniref:CdiA C-terminal domain-containing protein n=1 Tax=unclassified Solwaraspora TaxID=2627926 RepID=UPI00259B0800|nr:hypothetical protein [Solwaraspora sp. WMMA2056]WJK42728.1 hypothetical protein O7608_10290 [Solwaraspora sp. WMMA2056]